MSTLQDFTLSTPNNGKKRSVGRPRKAELAPPTAGGKKKKERSPPDTHASFVAPYSAGHYQHQMPLPFPTASFFDPSHLCPPQYLNAPHRYFPSSTFPMTAGFAALPPGYPGPCPSAMTPNFLPPLPVGSLTTSMFPSPPPAMQSTPPNPLSFAHDGNFQLDGQRFFQFMSSFFAAASLLSSSSSSSSSGNKLGDTDAKSQININNVNDQRSDYRACSGLPNLMSPMHSDVPPPPPPPLIAFPPPPPSKEGLHPSSELPTLIAACDLIAAGAVSDDSASNHETSSNHEIASNHNEKEVFLCPASPHSESDVSEELYLPHQGKPAPRAIRVPKERKTHSCVVCQKSFHRKDRLDAHMVQHTGFKPFSCDECGKRFSRGDNLLDHYKVRHAKDECRIQCHICCKRFLRPYQLAAHKKVYHGDLDAELASNELSAPLVPVSSFP